jgi:hypothetical protein
MGQNLLRKNNELASLTKASTESEPSADQRMQFCPDEQLLPHLLDFHQDAEGHWVAHLACGHSQHLRHQPPWQNRAWVLAAEQRQARLGKPFPCGWCRQQASESTFNENN